MKSETRKTIAREGLIFIGLFGISYIIYLVTRLIIWANKAMKQKEA